MKQKQISRHLSFSINKGKTKRPVFGLGCTKKCSTLKNFVYMDCTNLASGDNNTDLPLSPRYTDDEKVANDMNPAEAENIDGDRPSKDEVTPQMIEDNETKLKDRISQCRQIIESLKSELNDEKAKLEKETIDYQRKPQVQVNRDLNYACGHHELIRSEGINELLYPSINYSDCVDRKLSCDENLMEYEKQLQKYQNTLNMAQIEKKNAIRKQMLAKAFRLKLLEVENQCNIELLRVKQSLQCLEPLQMIANSWKENNSESKCDLTNLELLPIYPDLGATSGSDIAFKEELLVKMSLSPRKEEEASKDTSTGSD